MAAPLNLGPILPKDSKLELLLQNCQQNHELHLHELSDGALSMVCFNCPFRWVLTIEEEKIVREQMEAQKVK